MCRFTCSSITALTILFTASSLAAQNPRLEFHYEFDTDAPPLIDSTGNHGALGLGQNGVEHRFGEESLIGDDGFSIGLDAPGLNHPTGSYLVVRNAPQPESFTYSIWIKPLLTGTTQAILDRDNVWWPSPCAYYCLYIDQAQSLVWKTGTVETIISEEALIEDEEVYHVVVTHLDTDGADTGSADRSRLYLNGELIEEAEDPEEIPSLDSIADENGIYQFLWVGTMSSFGGYWGEMDDFQMYDTELTPEQVAQLYSNPGSVIDFGGGIEGDFDKDGDLDADDIDALSAAVRAGDNSFDITGDGMVNNEDRVHWVENLKRTYFGDANLDGEFNSTDFVVVFTANEYEDAVDGNSSWAEGDWNGDADFNSTDFVVAFQGRGYEQGPRPAAVPEPDAVAMLVPLVIIGFIVRRRRI